MRKIYFFAKKFLIRQIPSKNAKEVLNSYLDVPDCSEDSIEKNELFRRLLSSAQNTNMKAGVIGGSIGGFDKLGKALFSFNPSKVQRKFKADPDALLNHIIKTLSPRGQIRNTPKSIWPQYCKTILSAAAYLDQFETGEAFYEWANHLYRDPRSKAALPLILKEEIYGIGYPRACYFLSELGFINYGMPTAHIKDIFSGIGLCEKNVSDYQIQKIISAIADAANVSSYNVDTLFWLINMGNFYKHLELGFHGRISGTPKNRPTSSVFISANSERSFFTTTASRSAQVAAMVL